MEQAERSPKDTINGPPASPAAARGRKRGLADTTPPKASGSMSQPATTPTKEAEWKVRAAPTPSKASGSMSQPTTTPTKEAGRRVQPARSSSKASGSMSQPAATPTKEPGRKVRAAPTPSKASGSLSQPAPTPTKEAGRKVQPACSPSKASRSMSQPATTPIKEAGRKVRASPTPSKASGSMSQPAPTPTKEAGRKVQPACSPSKASRSMSQPATTPIKEAGRKVRAAPTPSKASGSMSQPGTTPTKEAGRKVQPACSPSKASRSMSQPATTPIKEAGRKVRAAPTPSKASGSMIQPAPTPTKEAGRKVQPACSPSKASRSMSQPAATPIKEAGRKVRAAPTPSKASGSMSQPGTTPTKEPGRKVQPARSPSKASGSMSQPTTTPTKELGRTTPTKEPGRRVQPARSPSKASGSMSQPAFTLTKEAGRKVQPARSPSKASGSMSQPATTPTKEAGRKVQPARSPSKASGSKVQHAVSQAPGQSTNRGALPHSQQSRQGGTPPRKTPPHRKVLELDEMDIEAGESQLPDQSQPSYQAPLVPVPHSHHHPQITPPNGGLSIQTKAQINQRTSPMADEEMTPPKSASVARVSAATPGASTPAVGRSSRAGAGPHPVNPSSSPRKGVSPPSGDRVVESPTQSGKKRRTQWGARLVTMSGGLSPVADDSCAGMIGVFTEKTATKPLPSDLGLRNIQQPAHPTSQPALGNIQQPAHPTGQPALGKIQPALGNIQQPAHPTSQPALGNIQQPAHPTGQPALGKIQQPGHPAGQPALGKIHPALGKIQQPAHPTGQPALGKIQPALRNIQQPAHPTSSLAQHADDNRAELPQASAQVEAPVMEGAASSLSPSSIAAGVVATISSGGRRLFGSFMRSPSPQSHTDASLKVRTNTPFMHSPSPKSHIDSSPKARTNSPMNLFGLLGGRKSTSISQSPSPASPLSPKATLPCPEAKQPCGSPTQASPLPHKAAMPCPEAKQPRVSPTPASPLLPKAAMPSPEAREPRVETCRDTEDEAYEEEAGPRHKSLRRGKRRVPVEADPGLRTDKEKTGEADEAYQEEAGARHKTFRRGSRKAVVEADPGLRSDKVETVEADEAHQEEAGPRQKTFRRGSRRAVVEADPGLGSDKAETGGADRGGVDVKAGTMAAMPSSKAGKPFVDTQGIETIQGDAYPPLPTTHIPAQPPAMVAMKKEAATTDMCMQEGEDTQGIETIQADADTKDMYMQDAVDAVLAVGAKEGAVTQEDADAQAMDVSYGAVGDRVGEEEAGPRDKTFRRGSRTVPVEANPGLRSDEAETGGADEAYQEEAGPRHKTFRRGNRKAVVEAYPVLGGDKAETGGADRRDGDVKAVTSGVGGVKTVTGGADLGRGNVKVATGVREPSAAEVKADPGSEKAEAVTDGEADEVQEDVEAVTGGRPGQKRGKSNEHRRQEKKAADGEKKAGDRSSGARRPLQAVVSYDDMMLDGDDVENRPMGTLSQRVVPPSQGTPTKASRITNPPTRAPGTAPPTIQTPAPEPTLATGAAPETSQALAPEPTTQAAASIELVNLTRTSLEPDSASGKTTPPTLVTASPEPTAQAIAPQTTQALAPEPTTQASASIGPASLTTTSLEPDSAAPVPPVPLRLPPQAIVAPASQGGISQGTCSQEPAPYVTASCSTASHDATPQGTQSTQGTRGTQNTQSTQCTQNTEEAAQAKTKPPPHRTANPGPAPLVSCGMRQVMLRRQQSLPAEPTPAQTIMEAQERGEQLQIQDDAKYALDGLQPLSSLTTQRNSLISLAEILSTRKGRAALRADSLAQQVLTAGAKIRGQNDPVIALTLSTILFLLSGEDVNPSYMASSAAAVLMSQLLQVQHDFKAIQSAGGVGGASTSLPPRLQPPNRGGKPGGAGPPLPAAGAQAAETQATAAALHRARKITTEGSVGRLVVSAMSGVREGGRGGAQRVGASCAALSLHSHLPLVLLSMEQATSMHSSKVHFAERVGVLEKVAHLVASYHTNLQTLLEQAGIVKPGEGEISAFCALCVTGLHQSLSELEDLHSRPVPQPSAGDGGSGAPGDRGPGGSGGVGGPGGPVGPGSLDAQNRKPEECKASGKDPWDYDASSDDEDSKQMGGLSQEAGGPATGKGDRRQDCLEAPASELLPRLLLDMRLGLSVLENVTFSCAENESEMLKIYAGSAAETQLAGTSGTPSTVRPAAEPQQDGEGATEGQTPIVALLIGLIRLLSVYDARAQVSSRAVQEGSSQQDNQLVTGHSTIQDCLHAAVAVLMNITHQRSEGAEAVVSAGGLNAIASLVASCCGLQPHAASSAAPASSAVAVSSDVADPSPTLPHPNQIDSRPQQHPPMAASAIAAPCVIAAPSAIAVSSAVADLSPPLLHPNQIDPRPLQHPPVAAFSAIAAHSAPAVSVAAPAPSAVAASSAVPDLSRPLPLPNQIDSKPQRQVILKHLEVLTVCLGLLINLTSASLPNRHSLAQAVLQIPCAKPDSRTAAGTATCPPSDSSCTVIPLLCGIINAMLSKEDSLALVGQEMPGSAPAVQGASPMGDQQVEQRGGSRQGHGAIVKRHSGHSGHSGGGSDMAGGDAYSSMLLGFLVQHELPLRSQAASLLAFGSLTTMVSAIERCLAFYVNADAITEQSRAALMELLESLRQEA
eukprot:gene5561-4198_t